MATMLDDGEAPPTAGAQTRDRMLAGRLTLRQPKAGYRAGLDAALLAAALGLESGQTALEAGCGVGGALLQAAARAPRAELVGVERDRAALAFAQANIADNGFEDRVSVIGADICAGFEALNRPPFDAVFANPPFFDDPASLRAPHPARRDAWITEAGLGAWCAFLIAAVRRRGEITVVHRAARLADLLAELGLGSGSILVRPVQPFADRPAKRVLVRAIKGGRAPLVLLPALVLHDRSGAKHMPEADAILRGDAALGWD